MSISPPVFACTLQARIPAELEALYLSSRTQVSNADKMIGIELLTEAYFDLIDTCFVRLLDNINRTHPSKELQEAHRVIEEIKDKSRHYLSWTAGFISNERLPPVIAHFYALTYQGGVGGDQPYMAFNLSQGLAAEIQRVLPELANGRASSFDEGIELLIQVIEEATVPLAIEPKNLMKFNFVVNKTLDGVIALVRVLFKRMLRKIASKLPRELFPQVAAHLETFLIVR